MSYNDIRLRYTPALLSLADTSEIYFYIYNIS